MIAKKVVLNEFVRVELRLSYLFCGDDRLYGKKTMFHVGLGKQWSSDVLYSAFDFHDLAARYPTVTNSIKERKPTQLSFHFLLHPSR
jgi:hypothetical protein